MPNQTDFRPTASIEILQRRSDLIRRIHEFFWARGFIHVETPVLSADTVVDRYIDPISVASKDVCPRLHSERLWMQTSPEFAMKRLLAAGAHAIYQITPAFRAEERGSRHNPEFTMLEWYRVGDTMQDGIQLLAEFAETLLDREKTEVITYRNMFRRYVSVDPFTAFEDDLQECLVQHGIAIDDAIRDSTDRDGWLNMLLGCSIEPQLGVSSPQIVCDWPASQSALAVVREDEVPVAERFELYVDGVELANGYHELLDPLELEKRNRANNRQRIADGKPVLPEESHLLDAMRQGLPACAGVALGVDRLAMLALDAESIEDVLAFPIERA